MCVCVRMNVALGRSCMFENVQKRLYASKRNDYDICLECSMKMNELENIRLTEKKRDTEHHEWKWEWE